MLFLPWFSKLSWKKTTFAWACCAGESARVASPTSVRRTAWVCRVAVRPRVPPCAGERSGRSIWIPAHRASCRGDRTLLSPTFQRLLRLSSALGGRRRVKKKKCYRWLPLSHVPVGWRTIPSVRHSRRCQRLPVLAPDLKLLSYNSSQQLKTISWVSSERSESLERLDSGRGRWDDLCCPPYSTPTHTHTNACAQVPNAKTLKDALNEYRGHIKWV